MKNIQRLVYSIIILSILTSCEKVINVDIDNAKKAYVIEGTISNISSPTEPTEVKISFTRNFSESNTFDGVSGADVSIQVNADSIYKLTEVATGVYRNSAIVGIPGNTYHLTVFLAGKTYTATSTMPLVVNLDSITVNNNSFGGEAGSKSIDPLYHDPVGKGNSYRLIEYVNGMQVKKVFVQNDDFSDGKIVTQPLINQDGKIKSGNFVTVEMQCIDANMYLYWNSLDQSATGDSQSATPANPVTNIIGGALGYFSAHSVTSKSIVIP